MEPHWLQPVAIGAKSERLRKHRIKRKPLPRIATICRTERGSCRSDLPLAKEGVALLGPQRRAKSCEQTRLDRATLTRAFLRVKSSQLRCGEVRENVESPSHFTSRL